MSDMASVNAPFGLMPYGPMRSDACHFYSIVTSCASAFYRYDVVENGGTSLLTPAMGNVCECVVEAEGALGSILGSVIGLFDKDMTPVTYIANGEVGNGVIAGYALVCDSPMQRYIIQEDGDTSSIVAANIGLNADLMLGTGDTGTGLSGMTVDSSSVAVTNSLAVKLLGVHPEDTISAAGAAGNYCRFIVMVNSANHAPNVVGV